MKTVFFWYTISIFFEIVLTVLSEKRRIYFEKYRNRYSDLSRTDAPYQGKDKSNVYLEKSRTYLGRVPDDKKQ